MNDQFPMILIFSLFRANSTIAICIPKQIPRNGIFFSLAYFIAEIFPSVPLLPKPPGINNPETFFSFVLISLFFKLSDSILIRFTFTLFAIPP